MEATSAGYYARTVLQARSGGEARRISLADASCRKV
jgi:hypothetical protein